MQIHDLETFGGKADWNGTTGTDNLAAFNALVASMPNTGEWAGATSRGGAINFRNGRYYFSNSIVVQRVLHLRGAGNGPWRAAAGTELVFPKNVTGIRIHSSMESPSGNSGAYSTVKGFYLRCNEKDISGHGIHMSAMAHIQDVTVENFKGNGVNIVATSGSSTGNANLWRMDRVNSSGNSGHGIYVSGGDANAGLATMCAFSSNGLTGITDDSSLGNTYVGCLTEANVGNHAVTTNPTAYNIFLGCYAEGGPGANQGIFVYPTMVIGGSFATPAWITAASTGVIIGNDTLVRARLKYANGLGTDPVGSALGGGTGDIAMIALSFGATSESSSLDAWKLKFDATNKYWFLQFANSTSYEPISFPNSVAPRNAVGTGPMFMPGYFVGTDRSLPILRGFAAAAPVAGAYVVGDIVYNNAPAAGGTIGWVCTTAGNPGTWKAWGTIAA